MKNPFILIGLLLVALLTGCVSPPKPEIQPPPAPSVRVKFGRVGVLAYSRSTAIKIQMPAGKAQAARECARQVAWEPLNQSGGGDIPSVPGVLAWLAVGSAVGGTYGALAGEPNHSLELGKASLSGAVQGVQFEKRLAEIVRQQAGAQTGRQLCAVPPACRVEHHVSSDVYEVYFGNTYTNLLAAGVDTVLELEVIQPALAGAAGVNSRLAFGMDVKVRMLAAADGQLLYGDYLQYRSPKRSFSEWAANDARQLRREIQLALEQVSREVVSQIFVRTTAVDFPADSKLQHCSK